MGGYARSMPRPIWRGVLSFGMVAIPVRLSLATETSAKVSFNMLCAEHRTRVNQKLWCAQGEHELKRNETVKGYEYEKGGYVVLEDADLKELPLRSSKTIDIAGFIKDSALAGPLYYQGAYYLEPEKAAAKPYALLTKTLASTGRVAIAKFALRERERLVSLRAIDGALLLNTLHWPDEIRGVGELDIPEVQVAPAEVTMAESLVEMMAMEFDPAAFRDEYKDAVDRIVRAKVGGGEVVEAAEPAAETTVIDLMDALRASVEKAKERAKQTEKAERPAKTATARRKAS